MRYKNSGLDFSGLVGVLAKIPWTHLNAASKKKKLKFSYTIVILL